MNRLSKLYSQPSAYELVAIHLLNGLNGEDLCISSFFFHDLLKQPIKLIKRFLQIICC